MTDPESPETKNEQELNLFDDQPQPEAGDGGTRASEAAAPEQTDGDADFEQRTPEQEARPEFQPDAGQAGVGPDDDAPVVAPPPRRTQAQTQASAHPGAVAAPPQRGKRPLRTVPGAAGSSAQETLHKPLPHPIQPGQTLGQTLTAIREARGLPIEEVALATRIRLEYLTELEADELLKALPTVYVSAYVRKLIDVYDLSQADSELLLEKMRGEIPQAPEDLPDKLLESVNEGGMVNEGENKRIRNITILFFSGVAVILIAIIWLVILLIVRHSGKQETTPTPAREAMTSGEAADPADATSGEAAGPAAPTPSPAVVTSGEADDSAGNGAPTASSGDERETGIAESDFDALTPPERLDSTILNMNSKRGVRNTP